MSFDNTGLTEIRMQKRSSWYGSYYVNPDIPEECVAKTCSICRKVLPAASFGRHAKGRFGLASRCRPCVKVYDSAVHNTITESGITRGVSRARDQIKRNIVRTSDQIKEDQERLRPSGDKKCRTCRTIKPLSEYYAHRSRIDGLSDICISCDSVRGHSRHTQAFVAYWTLRNIPNRCYLCDGPYEEIEHLIPVILGGDYGPENTRPVCIQCNRGPGGKHDTPLEKYIFKVNHPTKTRAQILYEIVMSGTWPFANTTPEEFTAL